MHELLLSMQCGVVTMCAHACVHVYRSMHVLIASLPSYACVVDTATSLFVVTIYDMYNRAGLSVSLQSHLLRRLEVFSL